MPHAADDSPTSVTGAARGPGARSRGAPHVALTDAAAALEPTFLLGLESRRFLAVSDAAVAEYGWSRREFLRMSADDIRPRKDLERFDALVAWLRLFGERPLGGCHLARHRRRDGSTLDVEVTWSATPGTRRRAAWSVVRPLRAREATRPAGAGSATRLAVELGAIHGASTLDAALRAAAGAARRLVGARLAVIGLDARRGTWTSAPPAPPGAVVVRLPRYEAKPLGRLVVAAPSGGLHGEAMALLDVVAAAAAAAVAFHRLRRAHRADRRRVRGISRRITAAHEEERARIARELHDDLGGLLTSAQLMLHAAPAGEEPAESRRVQALRLVAEAIGSVRDLSHGLAPDALGDLGLEPAVERHVRRWGVRTGIAVDLATAGLARAIPSDAGLAALRVVQEALTNVARHAGAARVRVEVRASPRGLVVSVEDDGAGFDPDSLRPSEGFGLRSLRDRLGAVGGRLTVRSARGRGTRLRATIPVERLRRRVARTP